MNGHGYRRAVLSVHSAPKLTLFFIRYVVVITIHRLTYKFT